MLVAEGKQRLLAGFNAQPHALPPDPAAAAAEDEAEKELIAQFYADQQARRRQPPPQLSTEPPSQSNPQFGAAPHAQKQPDVAAESTTTRLPHDFAVRQHNNGATEVAVDTTITQQTIHPRQTKSGHAPATLEEFRQQLLRQKLQRRTEADNGHTTARSHPPLAPVNLGSTTDIGTQQQKESHNRTSINTGQTTSPSLLHSKAHEFNELHNSSSARSTTTTNTMDQHHFKSLSSDETSDRDAIVQAEEAGRRAALGAARSGATAIAAAEALGLTETSGRDAIVQAEEAGRRAALGAARSGATAIAAAEALGLTETSDRDAIVQAEEAGRTWLPLGPRGAARQPLLLRKRWA
ncbi:uncharacterized protein Tco025E_01093 [Trypanosoma conorhini]|uniref:Uncharacterized protein n=1 Tax=Trypanosoma conorhini TaxID=83891 RepID=A0A3R7PKH3_9TRYP|nr:uncharacterized protein Tco025E_01093 [Trypanosoma conorhini]RNF26695.1 hypothetical protein Tco025E_01093 [Trypanosoma conorhini]